MWPYFVVGTKWAVLATSSSRPSAPASGGLVTGVWLGGTLGGYVIKPSAAFFVELMAATDIWPWAPSGPSRPSTRVSRRASVRKVVFALVAYRRFNAMIVGAAGTVSFAFSDSRALPL